MAVGDIVEEDEKATSVKPPNVDDRPRFFAYADILIRCADSLPHRAGPKPESALVVRQKVTPQC